MIDKSIPYFDVVMVRPAAAGPVKVPLLPDGFAYRLYAPGDEAAWSDIEAAVDEFDTQAQAAAHFGKEFMPHQEALAKRMAFIMDANGNAVADATAWWMDDAQLGRVALLHWVAVKPKAQGLGLGRAVSAKALSLFETEGPQGDIWLTTQTWSHVAIRLYLSLGFVPHRSHWIGGHKNGFDGAARVLKDVLSPETYAQFMDSAMG